MVNCGSLTFFLLRFFLHAANMPSEASSAQVDLDLVDDRSFSRAQPERRTCPGRSTTCTGRSKTIDSKTADGNLCLHSNPSRRASSLTRALLPPPPVPPKPGNVSLSAAELQKVRGLTESGSTEIGRAAETNGAAAPCNVKGCFRIITLYSDFNNSFNVIIFFCAPITVFVVLFFS